MRCRLIGKNWGIFSTRFHHTFCVYPSHPAGVGVEKMRRLIRAEAFRVSLTLPRDGWLRVSDWRLDCRTLLRCGGDSGPMDVCVGLHYGNVWNVLSVKCLRPILLFCSRRSWIEFMGRAIELTLMNSELFRGKWVKLVSSVSSCVDLFYDVVEAMEIYGP